MMQRTICLDGVAIALECDRVEIDLQPPGLRPATYDDDPEDLRCCQGEKWQPVMTYNDGTTVYLHCPPEGEEGPLGYRVSGPRPHRWNITFLEETGPERVARLTWYPY